MSASLTRTQVSLSLTFVFSGLLFSTLASRMPDLRDRLDLSNTGFGLLVLAGAVGSMLAMPATGVLVARFGPAAVVRQGVALLGGGLTLVAIGLGLMQSVPMVVIGLVIFGVGFSLWDVAMSVEATAVERALGRTMLSRFHAARHDLRRADRGGGIGLPCPRAAARARARRAGAPRSDGRDP